MSPIEDLVIEMRSRLNKIAYHIQQLPSAENLPDETYIKVLSILQRTIKLAFDLLDSITTSSYVKEIAPNEISKFVGWIRFDLHTPLSNFKTAANFLYEKYDGQLSSEQRESACAIEEISEELINYIIAFDQR